MSKPFLRYEDTPLLMALEGQKPVMVFANSASLSVSQPIQPKKFVDDYQISFALQTGDVKFTGAYESGFMLGPPGGPATPISESIEIVKSGSKIAYPSGQSLFLAQDLVPGDYHIKVRSTGETTLRYEEDIEFGELEVFRNYAASGPIKGSLRVTYYMNTGNIHQFADVTGLVDPNVYPQVNESRVTGCLGDYFFEEAYIRELSLSAQPFQVITTNIDLDVYGHIKYVEGNAEKITNDYGCLREEQLTVPHAINTKLKGTEDVGIKYPLDFNYTISCQRNPGYEVPLSGEKDPLGEIPVRVTKESIDITARIQGEKLDPYLKIEGKRADLTVELSDIGFSKEFTDNNFGKLKEFKLVGSLTYPQPVPELLQNYGVVDEDALSVSEGGFLRGAATVKQSYR